MARHSDNFKRSMVRRMLLPDGPGTPAIAEETGIPVQTLHTWLRKLRGDVEMKTASADPRDRSILEKQDCLLEAASIPAADLGGWLREHGIHEEHLKLWKTEIRDTLRLKETGGKRELAALRKRNNALEKDLHKKDKALAEVTALLVLKKKLEGILFEPGEEQ